MTVIMVDVSVASLVVSWNFFLQNFNLQKDFSQIQNSLVTIFSNVKIRYSLVENINQSSNGAEDYRLVLNIFDE
jgi:hypothetical protein